MRESTIETYLRKQVQAIGGKAYKWSSPGNKAVPDRICLFPFHRVYFVEVKAPDKVPTPLQAKVIRSLRVLDCTVLVIDTKEKVNSFITMVKEDLQNEQQ